MARDSTSGHLGCNVAQNMAEKLKEGLKMWAHPTCGGWIGESYRSDLRVKVLDGRERQEYSALSIVYILLNENELSLFRQISADESIFWHKGSSFKVSIHGYIPMYWTQ